MESELYTSSDESIKLTDTEEANRFTVDKNKYFCPHEGCEASFSKNSKLVYHIRRHTGERPFACDEANCGKTYLYSFHLRRHKDTAHGELKTVERIRCPFEGCWLEMANKYSLKKHIKVKHDPERRYPFSCEECKQGFHKKRLLLQHSYVHTGVFPFKCEKCETRFLTQRDLNRHGRTHTNYFCACKEKFERWTSFLQHRKTCESAKHKCDMCNKKFINESKLKQHKDKHLNVTTYNCGHDDCKRSYNHRKNLVYHIRKCHQNFTKPRVACTEPNCGKTFTRNQNLLKHIKACHEGIVKEKKPRKPRKDKGKRSHCTSAHLAGLKLPSKLHHDVMQGVPVELPSIDKDASTTKDSVESVHLNESGTDTNVTENILLDGDGEDVVTKEQSLQNVNTILDVNEKQIVNVKLNAVTA